MCAQALAEDLSSKPGKTVTRSFRISETAMRALHEEASRKGVSVNTLLNQLLFSYTKYDRHLARFGLVKLSNPTFRRILEAASQKTIEKAGRLAGSNVPEALIDSMVGEVTLDSALDFLKMTGDFTDLFNYNVVPHRGKRAVTLSHNLGWKGSLFYEKYVEALFQSLDVRTKFTVRSDSLTFEI